MQSHRWYVRFCLRFLLADDRKIVLSSGHIQASSKPANAASSSGMSRWSSSFQTRGTFSVCSAQRKSDKVYCRGWPASQTPAL
jgi:hypothetical protein